MKNIYNIGIKLEDLYAKMGKMCAQERSLPYVEYIENAPPNANKHIAYK